MGRDGATKTRSCSWAPALPSAWGPAFSVICLMWFGNPPEPSLIRFHFIIICRPFFAWPVMGIIVWIFRIGVWHRWDMHSDCSDTDQERAVQKLKTALQRGADQLSRAHTLVLTLGTAYVYFLASNGRPVANCHRFPSSNFERRLVTVEEMQTLWEEVLEKLHAWRPDLQVWFTVSPVRHARDGLIENNRSKARLLELAHRLCDGHDGRTYFPSYEWQIDVLRDYRYYDTDLVHPNYAATAYIYDRLVQYAMKPEAVALLPRLESLVTADAHRSRLPQSPGNQDFEKQREKQWQELFQEYPYLAQRRNTPSK